MKNKKNTDMHDQNKKLGSINDIQKQEEMADAKMEKLNNEKKELLEGARTKANSIINSAIESSKKIRQDEISRIGKMLESRRQKDLNDIKATALKIKKTKADRAAVMKISSAVVRQIAGK